MKLPFILGVIVVVAVVVGLLIAWPANGPADDVEEELVAPEPEFQNVSTPGGQFIQIAPEVTPVAADPDEAEADSSPSPEGSEDDEQDLPSVSIDILDTGFSPEEVTVAAGTTIVFTNNGQGAHWPASDVHPTHQLYPGSDIAKCNSDESDTIFDACEGLATGATYSFTFTEEGTWSYHDHLNPSLTGSITVE